MNYVCQSCKQEVKDIDKFVTCPYCGAKVLRKERPPVAKKANSD